MEHYLITLQDSQAQDLAAYLKSSGGNLIKGLAAWAAHLQRCAEGIKTITGIVEKLGEGRAELVINTESNMVEIRGPQAMLDALKDKYLAWPSRTI